MADFATLVMAADTSRLKPAVTDLKAVTQAGADTEAGIKRSMKAVEGAVGTVPVATKKAVAGLNDLRMSLDPVYAASKQYEAAQKQVTAAVRAGTATQAEANKVLALAETRYLGVGTAAKTSNVAVKARDGWNEFIRLSKPHGRDAAFAGCATDDGGRGLHSGAFYPVARPCAWLWRGGHRRWCCCWCAIAYVREFLDGQR